MRAQSCQGRRSSAGTPGDSERFRFDHKNEVIFGLNLTYTPAGN